VLPLRAQKDRGPEFFYRSLKKRLAVINRAADFHVGDTIADIGAGAGWVDAALGVDNDSLTFYLEDIDSTHLKEGELEQALKVYRKIRGRPFSCEYVQAVGREDNTTLPTDTFDKVLLIDTYHHLEHTNEMIRDIHRILKDPGWLIVSEPLARKPGDLYKPCQSVISTREEIIDAMTSHGFRLIRTIKTVNSGRKKVRVFVFRKLPVSP
jgi:SAM-dependent methyltransferase